MKKTHEKSRIYTVTGTAKLKNPEKVVLQIEATGQRNTDNRKNGLGCNDTRKCGCHSCCSDDHFCTVFVTLVDK